MTNSETGESNIARLPLHAGRLAPKVLGSGCSGPLSPPTSEDPYIVDGLRLIRSFMLIDDADVRVSIIRLVEKIREQNRIFKK